MRERPKKVPVNTSTSIKNLNFRSMKKFWIIALGTLAIVGCTNQKDKEDAENAKALAAATHAELVQAVQERDQLINLINDITTTTNQIKEMEEIVSINVGNGESNSQQAQITNDLEAIKATLAQRRQKLEQLEADLKSSKTKNSKLLSTIENLKLQVSSQAAEIEQLQARLSSANEEIASLRSRNDTLITQVQLVSMQKDSVQTIVDQQEVQLNACYYAIGSKNELKENNIIEGGGFLRKQKIMAGDFDKDFFIQGDKRTLRSIPLHSHKAKVLTKYQPSTSYEIVDVNGQKVLNILDPDEFWGVSNYLVVQID